MNAGAGILEELASDLAAEGDLPELLKRFLVPLLRMSGADAGAVRAISHDGGQLYLVSSVGLSGAALRGGWTAHRDCGACGSAASADDMMWANGQAGCPQLGAIGHPGGDFQRMLAVPLKHRGRMLGVYSLFFRRADSPEQEVLSVLKSVGDLLGLALNNARLEEEQLRATLLQERQVMAAEVHDSVAQSLTFVKMRLPLLHDAMRARDDALAQRYFDDVRSAVTQAHSGLRGILANFRAPMDPHGLVHALDASAQTFRRSTGAELEFVNDLPGLRLAPEQETQVFHIVQEALTNVARHAVAQHARLHIGAARRGEVEIVVEDDGAGLPPATAGGTHYGMQIMLERARRIGGTLEVGARQGGGTRVRLSFPLSTAPSAVAAAGAR